MVKPVSPSCIRGHGSLDWTYVRGFAIVVPGDYLNDWEHGSIGDDGLPASWVQVVREIDKLPSMLYQTLGIDFIFANAYILVETTAIMREEPGRDYSALSPQYSRCKST